MPTCYECNRDLSITAGVGGGTVHLDETGNAIRVAHDAIVRPDKSRSFPPAQGDYPPYTAEEQAAWPAEWKAHYESGEDYNETALHPRDRKNKPLGYQDANPPKVETASQKAARKAALEAELAALGG
jgi:hypothetical protein